MRLHGPPRKIKISSQFQIANVAKEFEPENRYHKVPAFHLLLESKIATRELMREIGPSFNF